MARVAVVTGTTGGIGTEIARALAAQGFTVAMHGRDHAKLDPIVAAVRQGTGNAEVHAFVGDLGDQAAVRKLAAELGERFPAIDALVHNAAIVPSTRSVTPQGLETAWAVNVVAPYLLSTLLHPRLAAARGRVVTFFGGGEDRLDFDDLQSEKPPYDGWKTYIQTKNAVAAMTLALAERETEGVRWFVNLPGLVNTPGMRTLPGRMVWFARLFGWAMRTPEQGARTAVWLASGPDGEATSGKGYGNLAGSGWKKELSFVPCVTVDNGRRVLAACEEETV